MAPGHRPVPATVESASCVLLSGLSRPPRKRSGGSRRGRARGRGWGGGGGRRGAAGREEPCAGGVEPRARFRVLDASAAGPRPEVLVRRLRSTSPNAFVIGVGEVAGGAATLATEEI